MQKKDFLFKKGREKGRGMVAMCAQGKIMTNWGEASVFKVNRRKQKRVSSGAEYPTSASSFFFFLKIDSLNKIW